MKPDIKKVTALPLLALSVCAANAGAESGQELMLDEIVVTAQKREERLIDIPLSASVFTSDQIDLEGIVDGRQVAQRSPGVTLSDFAVPFASDILIRGAGVGRRFLSENATGLYRNDAFAGGATFIARNFGPLDFFDVERIEVLRGPQSALYGRNSVGGAINVINKVADVDSFEASVRVKYAEEGLLTGQAIVNVPIITGELAVRLGVISKDDDGGFFVDQNGNAVDQDKMLGGRIAIAYEASPDFSLHAFIDAYDTEEPSFSVFTYDSLNGQDPFVKDFNSDVFAERNGVSSTVRADYETNAGTLTYVGSYRKSKFVAQDDFSQAVAALDFGFFGNILDTVRTTDDDFWRTGHELRFASDAEQRLDYLVGLEYSIYEDEILVANTGSTAFLIDRDFDFFSDIRTTSYALFGQVTYDITDRFNLAAQLRYSRDEKEFSLTENRTLVSGTLFAPVFTPFSALSEESRNYNAVSPGLVLSLFFTPDLHGYAKVTTGYRSGSANHELGDPSTPVTVPFTQGKETTTAYEIGLKSRWPETGVQFNAAIYRQDFEDMHTQVTSLASLTNPATPAGRGFGYLEAISDATQYGVELDGVYYTNLGSGDLLLRGALSWIDGEFTSGPQEGNEIAMVRDWQFTASITYRRPLFSGLKLFVNYAFKGERGGAEDVQNLAELDNFEVHDVRIGVSGDDWRVYASVDNATDTQYDSFSFDEIGLNNYTNRPSRWSVIAEVNF